MMPPISDTAAPIRANTGAQRLHEPLALGGRGGPIAWAACGSPGRATGAEVVEGVVDLEPVQKEDVLGVLDRAPVREDLPERAHSVPEDRVVPVLDVEVV